MLLAMVSVCLTLTREGEVGPRVPPHLPITVEHFMEEDEQYDGREERGGKRRREKERQRL